MTSPSGNTDEPAHKRRKIALDQKELDEENLRSIAEMEDRILLSKIDVRLFIGSRR